MNYKIAQCNEHKPFQPQTSKNQFWSIVRCEFPKNCGVGFTLIRIYHIICESFVCAYNSINLFYFVSGFVLTSHK